MTETYVSEYLEGRIRRDDYPVVAAVVVGVLLRAYRRAVRNADWHLASEIGALLIEVANEFKGEPDFPARFVRP